MKPKLTIPQQINHMKAKQGILFNLCSEQDATTYLEKYNYYYRVKSYAKNYDQYSQGTRQGKYIGLDFAYLQEMSTIDYEMRKILLQICIDIEHFLKVKLVKDIADNPEEDGYGIVTAFLKKYPTIRDKFSTQLSSGYCNDIIQKCEQEFSIWVLVELLSYGDFSRLFALYYDKYPEPNTIYLKNLIWSSRMIRNATAHNNCLLNSLRTSYNRSMDGQKYSNKINEQINTFIAQNIPSISRGTRKTRLQNIFINDFVATLHLFNLVVTSPYVRQHRFEELNTFISERCIKNKVYFEKNLSLVSSYEFIKKIVDFYCQARV